MTAFHTFLKTEFSEENLDFWLACEDFKKTRSKTKLASKANRIFEEFVQTEAPREVRAFSASVLWHRIGRGRNKISQWVLLKCSQLSGKMCSWSWELLLVVSHGPPMRRAVKVPQPPLEAERAVLLSAWETG